MSIKRIVDTSFWNDDKVVELFTPEDKLFMLYVLTNPYTTQLGIYKINKKVMAFELGYSMETINILLDRFQNKYKIIIYSSETSEIAIKNFLRYSIVKGGKPVEDCLAKEIKQVKNKKLISYVFNNIKEYSDINQTIDKIIKEYNYNDNDNDNDVSYHDSYHDSSKKEIFKKPTVEEIAEYCKERNNGIDAQYFWDSYNAKDWMIGKQKMKDWKSAIRTWERNKKKGLYENKKEEIIPDWMNQDLGRGGFIDDGEDF